jgi:hypothetical protein
VPVSLIFLRRRSLHALKIKDSGIKGNGLLDLMVPAGERPLQLKVEREGISKNDRL